MLSQIEEYETTAYDLNSLLSQDCQILYTCDKAPNGLGMYVGW